MITTIQAELVYTNSLLLHNVGIHTCFYLLVQLKQWTGSKKLLFHEKGLISLFAIQNVQLFGQHNFDFNTSSGKVVENAYR